MSIRTLFYIALLLSIVYLLFTIGFPFLLAFVLAFMLEPLVRHLSKALKIKYPIAAVLVCTVFTLLILWLGYLIVVVASKEAVDLFKSLAYSTKDLSKGINSLLIQYNNLFETFPPEYQYSLQQIIGSIIDSLQKLLLTSTDYFINAAKQVPNILIELLLMFVAMYLFSMRITTMKDTFLRFFTESSHPRVNAVLASLQKAVFGFIRAQLIISCLVFIVVLIGFIIMDIPYSSALALFITIVDILPILGTGSVMIPMAIYHYLSGSLFMGICIIIHYVIIIAFRKIIEPKILADAVGIGPLSALISIYLGFRIAGLAGVFMGPIIILLLQSLFKEGIIRVNIKFNNTAK